MKDVLQHREQRDFVLDDAGRVEVAKARVELESVLVVVEQAGVLSPSQPRGKAAAQAPFASEPEVACNLDQASLGRRVPVDAVDRRLNDLPVIRVERVAARGGGLNPLGSPKATSVTAAPQARAKISPPFLSSK